MEEAGNPLKKNEKTPCPKVVKKGKKKKNKLPTTKQKEQEAFRYLSTGATGKRLAVGRAPIA